MSLELSSRLRLTLWWIASIATSVICCSFLFVIFGSAIQQISVQMSANAENIAELQLRQDKLLREIVRLQNFVDGKMRVATDEAVTGAAFLNPVPETESKDTEAHGETEGQPEDTEGN